ncbi:MAG: hypothetical protein A2Y97_00025 [Nitrospirae bacterium RBG_13_39_12]|nr:MAG: hypothetical protein A2Y97_00025 [Nitrospirae bacterium RBG_13_39_12]
MKEMTFLRSLIEKTKANKLDWNSLINDLSPNIIYQFIRDDISTLKDGYYCEFGNKSIVIYIKEGSSSPQLALASRDFILEYEFDFEELSAPGELWRLFKLIQRKTHNVDKFIDEFTKE